MRIGVDATSWANARGFGRFGREILAAMARLSPGDEFLCFGDARSFAAWPHRLPNVRVIEVATRESPTLAASSTSNRSLVDMLRLTRAVWRERPEVFFSPTVYTYFPLPPGLRAVVGVHDTIPDRFPHLTLPTWRARLFWWGKIRLALAQARLVLTMSDHAARCITDVLHVPPDRIRVTTEAAADVYQPSTPDEQRAAADRAGVPADTPWFIYVGGFNPHKRVDLILAAHASLARTHAPAPHLLLVGARADAFHGEADRLDGIIRAAGTGDLVHWLGFVPDEELRFLHGGATALILPSELEGFGLPAVEAAACGTPVIATTESPLPELLRGGGYFVSPGNEDELRRAMTALLENPARRSAMARTARERASAMTWDNSAKGALAAIYEAAT